MNRTEHLLTCLAEECSEVAKRVSKAVRFGLAEIQNGRELTNAERIVVELKDLTAVAKILASEGTIDRNFVANETETAAKLSKIERYMEIAREQGALE